MVGELAGGGTHPFPTCIAAARLQFCEIATAELVMAANSIGPVQPQSYSTKPGGGHGFTINDHLGRPICTVTFERVSEARKARLIVDVWLSKAVEITRSGA